MQKKILYVGNFSFPNGNASGARVLGNGYLFRELGYKTFFIGLDKQLNENSNLPETRNEFEGFAYYNLPYPKGVRGWIAYKQRYIEVAKLIKDLNIDIIILYGSPTISLFGSLLKSFAKKITLKY